MHTRWQYALLKSILKRARQFWIAKKYHVVFGHRCCIGFRTTFEGRNRIGGRTSFSGSLGFASYMGSNCKIYAGIGRFCSIADHVVVVTGNHPVRRFVSTHPAFYSPAEQAGFTYSDRQKFAEYRYANQLKKLPVVIDNDVWIGYGATILEGVHIGDGAVVAANATVTKDVEPYAIVGGCPAKVIRHRFQPETVRFLLDFQWWNRGEQWIRQNAALFTDIDSFRAAFSKNKAGES